MTEKKNDFYGFELAFEQKLEPAPQYYFLKEHNYFHEKYLIIIHNKKIYINGISSKQRVNMWMIGKTKLNKKITKAISQYKNNQLDKKMCVCCKDFKKKHNFPAVNLKYKQLYNVCEECIRLIIVNQDKFKKK